MQIRDRSGVFPSEMCQGSFFSMKSCIALRTLRGKDFGLDMTLYAHHNKFHFKLISCVGYYIWKQFLAFLRPHTRYLPTYLPTYIPTYVRTYSCMQNGHSHAFLDFPGLSLKGLHYWIPYEVGTYDRFYFVFTYVLRTYVRTYVRT